MNVVDDSGNNLISALFQKNPIYQGNSQVKTNQCQGGRKKRAARKPMPSKSRMWGFNSKPRKIMKFGMAVRSESDNFKVSGQKFDYICNLIKTQGISPNIVFNLIKTEDDNEDDNLKNQKSYTLLTYSLRVLKNLELAEILIKMNSDLNLQDGHGKTMFMYAIQKNNLRFIELCKRYQDKIDFGLKDKDGNNLIHYCVSPIKIGTYHNTDLLIYLSDFCNINERNKKGLTPLDLAENQQPKKSLNCLIKLGAKKNQFRMKIEEQKYFILTPDQNIDYEQDYQMYLKQLF